MAPEQTSDNSIINAVLEDKIDEVTALVEQGLNINTKNDSGDNLLNVATTKGNVAMVAYLLENGADVGQKDSEGWYPIHTATRIGSTELVELFLKYGADVNAENENHTTPLCLSIRYGSPEMIIMLLQANANVNVASTNNWTPLHLAARFNTTEIVKMIVEHGADIQAKTEEGWSVIHFAAQYNALETVKYLVDNGADVNVKGANDATSLHLASLEGSSSMVDLLLSLGADIEAQDDNKYTGLMHAVFQNNLEKVELFLKRKCQLQLTNNQGWTVLHIAASYGSPEIAKLLMDSGAAKYINELDNKNNTALHHAIESGSPEMVQLLAEYADDINCKGSHGWTALHHVACYGNIEKLQTLLQKGAEINPGAVDKASTPLHVAAIYGSPDMIKMMLEHGANVNAIDEEGFAPIHSATRFSHPETVWLMLENGASANATTSTMWTPLHFAVENGDLDMVKMLCDKGAEINAQKDDGTTALHIALKSCTPLMIHMLIALGADVNISDKSGCLPLHMALLYGTNDVVDILLEQNVDTTVNNSEGLSPLEIAVQSKNVGKVQKMLDVQEDRSTLYESLAFAMYERCDAEILNMIDDAFLKVEKKESWNLSDLLVLYSKLTEISSDDGKLDNTDDFGQTFLHYAVKYGIKSHVKLFLENGMDVNHKDSCGTTPLQLSSSNPKLLQILSTILGDDFTHGEEVYSYAQWFGLTPNTDQITNEVLSIESASTWQHTGVVGMEIHEQVAKWLTTNEVNTEEAQIEFQLVHEGVDVIVKQVLALLGQSDPRMACNPLLIGSISEGTKCGYPDQFDYLCTLESFSKNVELSATELKQGIDLKIKDGDILSEFKDDNLNVDVTKMVTAFNEGLYKVLKDGSKMKESLPEGFIIEKLYRSPLKMPQINLIWCGNVFKYLKMKVDLQPAVEILVPEDRVRSLPMSIETGLFHAVPTSTAEGFYSNNFHISLAATETVLFRVLQEDIRFGYILAKTFLSSKICPNIDFHVLDEITKPKDFICTYLLKTCLFYELVEARLEGEPIEIVDDSEPSTIPERILVWADRIYARLEYFLEQGYLPSYYSPDYDLLFGHIVLQGNEIASKLRNDNKVSQKRSIMYAYCDLIRNKVINS